MAAATDAAAPDAAPPAATNPTPPPDAAANPTPPPDAAATAPTTPAPTTPAPDAAATPAGVALLIPVTQTVKRVGGGKTVDTLKKAAEMSQRNKTNSSQRSQPKRQQSSSKKQQGEPTPSTPSPYKRSTQFKRKVPLSELGLCEVVSPLANTLSPRSEKRMENGHCPHICNHDNALPNVRGLVKHGPLYFSSVRMQLDNYPTHCAVCKKLFATGRKVKNFQFARVNANNPAHCCLNAMNHRDHPCVHAKCNACVAGALSAQVGRSKRKRTQSNIVQPGESVEVGADGEVVVVPEGESARNRRKLAASKKRGTEPTTNNNKNVAASKANDGKKRQRQ